MNFVDDVKLEVRAGAGGSGAVHFRREKFVPRGGPDGGDGGNGGDVVITASRSLQTMADLSGLNRVVALDGQSGGPQNRTGHSGESRVIAVPPGTVVTDVETDAKLADLVEDGQTVVVAKGGRGGKGNWQFRSATNQTPEEFGPGTVGESRRIRLTLQLLADVGLVGLPNAGKSALLNRLTGAQARVANYPFTTVNPNLGVIRLADRDIIVADIPGLIKGAAAGRGLGHQFLKHVQRCGVLVHCVAADSPQSKKDYQTVRDELAAYNRDLAGKPEIVVITKLDLLSLDDQARVLATMESAVKRPVWGTSAVTGQGISDIRQAIARATS